MRGIIRFGPAAAALAALLVVSLAACTNDGPEKPTTLPPVTPSSSSPSLASTAGMSDEQQIRAIYADYTVRWTDVQGRPVEARRRFLSQWVTEPLLTGILDVVAEEEKNHRRYNGRAVPRILSVEIDDGDAEVEDCSDGSDVVVKDTRTGKVVDGPFARSRYVATLTKTKAGWRVDGNEMKDESCTGS